MERLAYLTLLEQKFQSHRIIALLGPRQCGKITLAKAYTQTMLSFSRRNYFDLENPNDLERLREPYQSL